MRLRLNRRQYLEVEKLALGVFAPVTGFMTAGQYRSVVDTMRLPGGEPFPLPILFDVTETQAAQARGSGGIELWHENVKVGELVAQEVFTCDKGADAEKIFGTRDLNHPGVASFLKMGPWFVGGQVQIKQRVSMEFSESEWTPERTRAFFAERGWRTVVGFQTRNVPHRGHEYLLRLALEQADGLFIQPLVGQKKAGDFTTEAVLRSYEALIQQFLPRERIALGVLSTSMRYAGPREAVFHAIIRRNYGCTHFIVGRDHAGVGNFYGKYAAHELTRRFEGELGIQVLRFAGPYFCAECRGIVTERTCPHEELFPAAVRHISGTDMRQLLSRGAACSPDLMRPEIVRSVAGLPLFIAEEELL